MGRRDRGRGRRLRSRVMPLGRARSPDSSPARDRGILGSAVAASFTVRDGAHRDPGPLVRAVRAAARGGVGRRARASGAAHVHGVRRAGGDGRGGRGGVHGDGGAAGLPGDPYTATGLLPRVGEDSGPLLHARGRSLRLLRWFATRCGKRSRDVLEVSATSWSRRCRSPGEHPRP